MEEIKSARDVHLRRARVSQKQLCNAREHRDPTVYTITMDLQKTLVTPRIYAGAQYYRQKLPTYNIGIHHVESGQAVMYIWDETEAKKGSCEIASCLLHYVQNNVPATVTCLVIFSDNCYGQNKSINIVMTLVRFIHSNRFTSIQQNFMVTTFLHAM